MTKEKVFISRDGKGDFKSIEEALKSNQHIAQITFKPGIYHEDIIIYNKKSLTIEGTSNSNTIILGQIIVREHSEVTIKNLTVKKRDIEIWNSDVTIYNCIIHESKHIAIDVGSDDAKRKSFSVKISNCKIINNGYGICYQFFPCCSVILDDIVRIFALGHNNNSNLGT